METFSSDFPVSDTSFFRDLDAFDFIQKNTFPAILERLTPGEGLKMWVAGCATGEDVYSFCIMVAELLKGRAENTVFKIFATDIDNLALAKARKGIYSGDIEKNVSAERLKHFFTKEGNNYKVKPFIRKMAIFAYHNLVTNPPYCNMHFISCSMMLYMTPFLQRKALAMLQFGLKFDGYLFLGASENPSPVAKGLQAINEKFKLYKNHQAKQEINYNKFILPELIDIKHKSVYSNIGAIPKNSGNAMSEAMYAGIVNEFGILAVCIDENDLVQKFYGDTVKYLLQKHFTTRLTELLPTSIRMAFEKLKTSVIDTGEKGSVTGIKIKSGEANVIVNLSICPLPVGKNGLKLLLVIFSEVNTDNTLYPAAIKFDEKIYYNQYTLALEDELEGVKDKLLSAYEQLDASNENIQSFNEEMISANEEMQSTNEEMQSINEELDIVNAEYQLKNSNLIEINDDLNNYFASNINGQLFINNDMKLMRFSPGTVKLINLLETDIGRLLSDISTNIKLETIIDDVKEILSTGGVITKEIETINGKWYQVMTMPYILQADKKQNGAIITFNDVTELKNTQTELDRKNNSLSRINEDLDNFIHAASHDLLAPLNNIEGSIELMNSIKMFDANQLDFLNVINSSVKKFRELITDIATIAKVEGDMLAMEMVDLEGVLNNIEWSLENRIEQSGAVIIRDLGVKQLLFSKKNLRSILYNLISNGIKFRRDISPVINITTHSIDGQVVLTVQDNGIGMDKRGLGKIFDMYGRLNQDIEGHGIGLYLAKKIINAANGSLTVESQPGKGSKFIIFFQA